MSEEQNIPQEKKENVNEHFPEDSHAPQPQTTDMEVHHHSHVHHQKKWKEYIFQFLMLFLAVFCGFLAEYKLEHVIEHQKGIQYIQSFVEDLQKDERSLSQIIPQYEEKDKLLDTLLTRLKKVTEKKSSNGIYQYYWQAIAFPDFIYTDRTMQQLKFSGGLRLITDRQVADSIVAYDAAVRQMQLILAEDVVVNVHRAEELNNLIIDFSEIPDIGTATTRSEMHYPADAPLLSYDTYLLKQYYNRIVNVKRAFLVHLDNLKNLQEEGRRLSGFLSKKYHLENE
jgi:hypothetical protein